MICGLAWGRDSDEVSAGVRAARQPGLDGMARAAAASSLPTPTMVLQLFPED